MGIKSKAGPGISILNTGVFDRTSKVHVHFTDIHTHNYVIYSLMCTRKEFLRETLDILVNITDWCFLGWYRMKWVASPVLTFLCLKAVLQF